MSMYQRKKKFHFIGIGGAGMSGLADILVELGHTVSGSDRQLSALTDYLSGRGVKIHQGHNASYVGDVDYIVYSSAIPEENTEMQAAVERGIPRIRRAELLGQLMNRHLGIAVAGTHGKTTTTSMIGEVLTGAGIDPTIIVGGRMKNSMTNARLGKSEILVAEADEYDRSFLALHPRISVITSLEADHLDIYEDLDDVKRTFTVFANQTAFDGCVIGCRNDENILEIAGGIHPTVIWYGIDAQADYRAEDVNVHQQSSEFLVTHRDQTLGKVKLAVPGKHNILNALAALVVCRELDVPFESIRTGLENFRGVERRFEWKAEVENILFYDDYAHHPSEIAATLRAARDGWYRRLVAVFQPHLFSRTRDFYREFAEALSIADLVIVTGIYPAREEPIPGVSGDLIFRTLNETGKKYIYYVEDKSAVPEQIAKLVMPGDLVITMGAGDIWYYGEQAIQACKSRFSDEISA